MPRVRSEKAVAKWHGPEIEALDPHAALSIRRRRGRHDEKRAPAGLKYDDHILVRDPRKKSTGWTRVTEADLILIEQVRAECSLLLDKLRATPPAGKHPMLHSEVRKALLCAFTGLRGHPFGEDWREALAVLLKTSAYVGEVARLRHAHGHPPLEPKASPLSEGARILRDLREICKDPLPPELTAEVIERQITKVNLGGAGGAGRTDAVTPEQAVEKMAKAFAITRRKPRL
jgi:hypothetical protein